MKTDGLRNYMAGASSAQNKCMLHFHDDLESAPRPSSPRSSNATRARTGAASDAAAGIYASARLL